MRNSSSHGSCLSCANRTIVAQSNTTTSSTPSQVLGTSLRAASLRKLLDEAFSSSIEDLPPIIECAELLSDFWASVKSKAYAQPETLSKSPAACLLLGNALNALKDDATIDLSPFDLPEHLIRVVLSEISPTALTTLSLSGNQGIGENFVRKILAGYPNIGSLHLLNTPQIPLNIKVDLVKGTKVSQLLDSELQALPFNRTTVAKDTPLTFINPPIHQMVLICSSHRDRDDSTDAEICLPEGGFDIEKLVGKSWRSSYNVFPFASVNQEPTRFLWALLKSFQYFESPLHRSSLLFSDGNRGGRILASCFATITRPDQRALGQSQIGPLSYQLFRSVKASRHMPRASGQRPHPIRPGEWTLVAIYEEGSRWDIKVRYAFVTAHPSLDGHTNDEASPNVLIEDMETFLQHAIPGEERGAKKNRKAVTKYWKNYIKLGGTANYE